MNGGDLPKGWRWVRLGEVAEIFSGSSAPQGQIFFEKGLYPFVRVQDLGRYGRTKNLSDTIDKINDFAIKNYRLKRAPKGTILFPKSGAAILTNNRAMLGIDAYIVSHLAAVKAIESAVLADFLYYWLCYLDVRRFIENEAYPSLKLSKIKSFQIPLPSLPEQRRIVTRIEGLVSRIEEAKRLRHAAREETDAIMPAALSQIYSKMEEEGVTLRPLGEVCEVNPSRKGKMNYPDDMLVTFVPMSAVDAKLGAIVTPEERPFAKVKKGYTWFVENDVLFAKITPCMQNGKATIAKGLLKGVGFGSTEFHVLRPREEVLPEWIYFFVRRPSFRRLAEASFTGSVGQQRVPESFLKSQGIPLPSLDEQHRIVTYLDHLQAKVVELRRLQEETEEEINATTSAILDRVFQGEL